MLEHRAIARPQARRLPSSRRSLTGREHKSAIASANAGLGLSSRSDGPHRAGVAWKNRSA